MKKNYEKKINKITRRIVKNSFFFKTKFSGEIL